MPDGLSFTRDDAQDMCGRLAKNHAAYCVQISNGIVNPAFDIIPPLIEALNVQKCVRHLSIKRCFGNFERLLSLSFLTEVELVFIFWQCWAILRCVDATKD